MARTTTLGLESLESRLNLSTLQGFVAPDVADGSMVQERSALSRLLTQRSLNSYQQLVDQFDVGGRTTSTTSATPTGLSATATSSAISLKWTDTATNETGYQVLRSTDGANFSVLASIARNSTSYTDTTASAGVTYFYEVKSVNKSVASAPSNIASAMIPAAPIVTLPAAPSSATFSNITQTSVTLSWSDQATNETGYRIYRSDNGGAWSVVAPLGADATTWTDNNLAAGNSYAYIVAAYNSAGEAKSTAASVTTAAPAPTLLTAPSAPTNPFVTNVTQTAVQFKWTDIATNETGYNIYRSNASGGWDWVACLGANATQFDDLNLTAGSQITYQIKAVNSAGESAAASLVVDTLAATPTPTPTPTPIPTPTPTPTPSTAGGVTITTRNMTSFTELVITGTTGNDSIMVTQSGGVLSITANGQTTTYSNTFGDMVIQGAAGDDNITVDSSVNIATLIYGGGGNNVISNKTTGKATIVTIGSGTNTVTGNGINTSFWVNTGDTVNASSTEVNLGGVNRVSNFYQPWTTSTTDPNYISTDLSGQNLKDPTDSGTTIRLTNSSFWGLGPTMNDINQGGTADCFFLAPLASLANTEQAKLYNMGVDLGDGTYAVRFVKNGVTTFVRVDGDLAAGGNAWGVANNAPGASGNLWGSIFEKAYAFIRSGANSYSSLNFGSGSQSYRDLGLSATAVVANSGSSSVLNLINSTLSAGKAMVANTLSSISSGAPLIASHVYTILGAYTDSTGTVMIRLRNPWGFDGAGADGNWSDGIITISYSVFAQNFGAISYVTA